MKTFATYFFFFFYYFYFSNEVKRETREKTKLKNDTKSRFRNEDGIFFI